MIMSIVIAFFVILAIWFVVGMVLDRPRNNPAAINESLKFEIENNLIRIAKENKEIADMHARSRKYFAELSR